MPPSTAGGEKTGGEKCEDDPGAASRYETAWSDGRGARAELRNRLRSVGQIEHDRGWAGGPGDKLAEKKDDAGTTWRLRLAHRRRGRATPQGHFSEGKMDFSEGKMDFFDGVFRRKKRIFSREKRIRCRQGQALEKKPAEKTRGRWKNKSGEKSQGRLKNWRRKRGGDEKPGEMRGRSRGGGGEAASCCTTPSASPQLIITAQLITIMLYYITASCSTTPSTSPSSPCSRSGPPLHNNIII